jgi:hypothetical protein
MRHCPRWFGFVDVLHVVLPNKRLQQSPQSKSTIQQHRQRFRQSVRPNWVPTLSSQSCFRLSLVGPLWLCLTLVWLLLLLRLRLWLRLWAMLMQLRLNLMFGLSLALACLVTLWMLFWLLLLLWLLWLSLWLLLTGQM